MVRYERWYDVASHCAKSSSPFINAAASLLPITRRQSPDETEEEKERREAHRHGKKTMKDERREFVKKNLKTEVCTATFHNAEIRESSTAHRHRLLNCSCVQIFIPSNADIEVGVPRPTDENDLNSCCIDNEVGTHRPGAGEKEGTGDGVVSIESCGTDLEDDDEEDDEEDCQKRPTCAICLEAFKAGDKVSSSHNMKCTHVFHRECVFEWLVKEESCPFCRRKFITQCRWM